MSGILGIWNLDGRPVDNAVFSKIRASLSHRGPDGEGVWIQRSVGLACHLFRVTPESVKETQPLVHSSGTVVVFDGRIDNRDELLRNLQGHSEISTNSPDPALVLAAYDAFGDRFTERLNGDFALGLFDPKRHQLLLARDSIGIRPLYYCRTGDYSFLFASEIKALLTHPEVCARPDDEFLAHFLLRGAEPKQGATFFDGISSVPPAHVAVLSPEKFVTRRYWDFDAAKRIRLRSFPEYAEAFRDHFEQAVRRRLRSAYPVAVSVSGGLDSSSIFCVAETIRQREPGRHPPLVGVSVTFSDWPDADEAAFLRDIERQYGVVIERAPLRPIGTLNESREAIRSVEGPFLDMEWGNATRSFFDTIHERRARVLLTGHWGDQMLITQAYLIDLFRRLNWVKVWKHLREFPRWLTDADATFFKRRFFRDVLACHFPDVLMHSFRRLRATTIGNMPHRSYYTEVLQKPARRWKRTTTLVEARSISAHARFLIELVRSSYHTRFMDCENKLGAMQGLEKAFPFLDRDLISFLIAIPGDIQTWKGVPKAILREAMRGVLPAAIAQRRWKADFTDLEHAKTESVYPELVSILESGGLAVKFGYVEEDMMRRKLIELKDRIYGRDALVSWSLQHLVALELWLQVFFQSERNGREEFKYANTG